MKKTNTIRYIKWLTVMAITNLLVMFLFFTIHDVKATQTNGSQILVAQNSKLILVGEIVKVETPEPVLTTAVHIKHQAVLLKVIEVVKGNYTKQFIKIFFNMGIDQTELPKFFFGEGKKLILLLEKEAEPSFCTDGILGEYSKTEQPSCYVSWQHTAIQANDVEIEAIKRFTKTYWDNKKQSIIQPKKKNRTR